MSPALVSVSTMWRKSALQTLGLVVRVHDQDIQSRQARPNPSGAPIIPGGAGDETVQPELAGRAGANAWPD
jgi:hypothetical protein